MPAVLSTVDPKKKRLTGYTLQASRASRLELFGLSLLSSHLVVLQMVRWSRLLFPTWRESRRRATLPSRDVCPERRRLHMYKSEASSTGCACAHCSCSQNSWTKKLQQETHLIKPERVKMLPSSKVCNPTDKQVMHICVTLAPFSLLHWYLALFLPTLWPTRSMSCRGTFSTLQTVLLCLLGHWTPTTWTSSFLTALENHLYDSPASNLNFHT